MFVRGVQGFFTVLVTLGCFAQGKTNSLVALQRIKPKRAENLTIASNIKSSISLTDVFVADISQFSFTCSSFALLVHGVLTSAISPSPISHFLGADINSSMRLVRRS